MKRVTRQGRPAPSNVGRRSNPSFGVTRELLFVHSEPEARAQFSELAVNSGLRTDIASDASEALVKCELDHYPVVVVAHDLVGMDGTAFAELLREVAPASSLLFLVEHGFERGRLPDHAQVVGVVETPWVAAELDSALRKALKQARKRAAVYGSGSHISVRTPEILLIEDAPEHALALRRMIERSDLLDCTVNWVTSLAAARAELRIRLPVAILTDLTLPDTTGLGSVMALRAQAHDIPIVVITGTAGEELALAALQSGAQDYLVKGSVRPAELARVIRFAIERQRAEQVTAKAHQDQLTGVFNRLLLEERVGSTLARLEQTGGEVLLAFLDLENFKAVNEAYGHKVGDAVLIEAARRLREVGGPGATVARTGGDEFALMTEVEGAAVRIPHLMALLTDALGAPYETFAGTFSVGVKIGVAVGPSNGREAGQLFRSADVALHGARSDAESSFRVFNPSMHDHAVARRRRLLELRGAVERGEFRLAYQPQLAVSSQALIGMEALLRWEHPIEGTIAPTEFVPLLEESGLIVPVGAWVLRRACQRLAEWHRRLAGGLRMAVNVSPRQLWDAEFPNTVASAIAETGIKPEYLELEITESMLVEDLHRAGEVLGRLREIGVRIAVDDFGTGYSSLAYLGQLPLHVLKLDRAFVRNVDKSSTSQTIARAVIKLGHSLGFEVVGEGVETSQELGFLSAEGCNHFQGFLCARPMYSEHFDQWTSGFRSARPRVGSSDWGAVVVPA
jgi:diguanylate cyclase (GGDEF)-like protein